MITLPAIAIITAAAGLQGMPITVGRAAAFFLSLVLAIILNFTIFFCIGLLAFWLTDVEKLFGTISIVLTVVSGGVFPLDIFDKIAELLTTLLPFGYTAQFPVNIINGRFGWERIGMGFAFQAGWILFFLCLGNYLWRRGIRHYSAVSG